jgi:CRP/FNR family transcriptional regulator, polysaccharide utilization system transcription regulator
VHVSNVLQNEVFSGNHASSRTNPADLFQQNVPQAVPRLLPVSYSKGGVILLEGQPACGVFLLRSGRAKEFLISNSGKTAIVRMATSGVILGLAAVLIGDRYESTVQALAPCEADYIKKGDFLQMMRRSARLGETVVSQLSRDCKQFYSAIRYLGAAGSSAERLARILLQWADESPLLNLMNESEGRKSRNEVSFRVTLTQEEIGQFVGTTRETTARILADFRQKKWITIEGSVWTITNAPALHHMGDI